jgi:dual specificity tyrosine-phosphorylation-regulated kinase 2/3/4
MLYVHVAMLVTWFACWLLPHHGPVINVLVLDHFSPDWSQGESYAPRPMTPQEAIKKFGSQLSAYEICEILDYPEIYFVGQGAKKIQGKVNAVNNGGYDEESGDYIAVQHDHVAYRYGFGPRLA